MILIRIHKPYTPWMGKVYYEVLVGGIRMFLNERVYRLWRQGGD
jgi:hypothetical protein